MTTDRTLVALPCKLSPGAFSGERVFDLELANSERYTSVAPRQFCWNAQGKLVAEKEPTTEADGLIAARVVNIVDDKQVQVEVPDGEVIAVAANALKARPTPITPPSRVPTA